MFIASFAQRFGALSAMGVFSAFLFAKKAKASEDQLHAIPMPWNHRLPWQSYDHASIRRGFFVYKNVCANCHSLSAIAYRHLINVCLTDEEAKAIAEDTTFPEGPNEEGEMYERPGVLTDFFPKPYANNEAARFANGGALPPDLSLIVKARPQAADYVFALLTGYRDPPAGIELREGLHYNPYFPGGALGMAQALMNDIVEYDDGTPANISQMAKDVTTFLCWTAEPEHDERKLFAMKTLALVALMVIPSLYLKRIKWSVLKSRKIRFF